MTLYASKVGLVRFGPCGSSSSVTNLFEALKVLQLVRPMEKFAPQTIRPSSKPRASIDPVHGCEALIPRVSDLAAWNASGIWASAFPSLWWTEMSLLGTVTEAFAANLRFLADEIFKQCELERGHLLFFTVPLITLLACYLLPA